MYLNYLQDLTRMVLNCKHNSNFHGIVFTNDLIKNKTIFEDVMCLFSLMCHEHMNFSCTDFNNNKNKIYLIKFDNNSYIFITSLETNKNSKVRYNQAIVDPDIPFSEYEKYIYPRFRQYKKHD